MVCVERDRVMKVTHTMPLSTVVKGVSLHGVRNSHRKSPRSSVVR